MKASLESAITRLLQQFTPRRRGRELVFLEPEPVLPPPMGDARTRLVGPRGVIDGGRTSGSIGALVSAGTTSTREAMRRQETAELFGELNAAAEKFARAHRRSLGMDQRSEHVAHLIATISRCVFGEHWDVGAAVQTALGLDRQAASAEFCELVDKGNLVRKRLRQSIGLEVDDAVRLGSQLDPVRQMPWKSSLPDEPIRFVVFPGLSSCGHVVVKQQVYTVSLREAREQGWLA